LTLPRPPPWEGGDWRAGGVGVSPADTVNPLPPAPRWRVRKRFADAMNDDFNTAAAIASLFRVHAQNPAPWIREARRRKISGRVRGSDDAAPPTCWD